MTRWLSRRAIATIRHWRAGEPGGKWALRAVALPCHRRIARRATERLIALSEIDCELLSFEESLATIAATKAEPRERIET